MVNLKVQSKPRVRKPKRRNGGVIKKRSIMAKKPMIQLPRPSTKPGKLGGKAGNNPPKPKK